MIRPGLPADAPALVAMFGRCSPASRYERFHGNVTELPKSLVAQPRSWVAERAPGHVVGMANAGPIPGAPHIRELAVLVEDAWQRRGVGGRLLRAALADAYADGVHLARLQLCRSRPRLVAHLLAALPVAAVAGDGCDLTLDVEVAAVALSRVSPPPTAVAAAR